MMTQEEWYAAQEKIQADCPILFRDSEAPGRRRSGKFYLECSSGWHDLIRECAIELERIANAMPVPENPEDDNRPRAAQIKEKFGGLRFYVYGEHTEEVDLAINRAEAVASMTCEFCGEPGMKRGLPWIRTLCFEHFKAEEARFAKSGRK